MEQKKQVYEKGCLMAYLQECDEHSEFLQKIDPEDVEDEKAKGIEDELHVTILYGLNPGISMEQVEDAVALDQLKQFSILCTGVHLFENEDYDVLIFRVESSVLYDMNALCKTLPHESNFPDYVPHMTIAYLKKGCGKKYVDVSFAPFLIKCDQIVYSAVEVDPSGDFHNDKHKMDLPEKDPMDFSVGHQYGKSSYVGSSQEDDLE